MIVILNRAIDLGKLSCFVTVIQYLKKVNVIPPELQLEFSVMSQPQLRMSSNIVCY